MSYYDDPFGKCQAERDLLRARVFELEALCERVAYEFDESEHGEISCELAEKCRAWGRGEE